MNAFTHNCILCKKGVLKEVAAYSHKFWGKHICRDCQKNIKKIESDSTLQVLALYEELIKQNIPAKVEYYDGHKHIDIRIEDARLDIEVDGMQHYTNENQGMADLKRTYFSYKKAHYYTLRIPNKLIDSKLEELVKELLAFIDLRVERVRQNISNLKKVTNYKGNTGNSLK